MEHFFLFIVAIIAGAINSVAGGGSFLSFPALLFTGMPSIAANATNTIALWPGSIASTFAYKKELGVHKERLKIFAFVSFMGGLIGALTLLATPETTFKFLIPYLLLVAALIYTFGRHVMAYFRLTHPDGEPVPLHTPRSLLLQFTIAIYGGYFGAGIGILMLATFELLGLRNIHEMNGLKTVLAIFINGISVLTFVIAGIIVWPAALVMIAGAVIGGYGGAALSKKFSSASVRRLVIIIAWVMTAYFFIY